jgi:hypothetical protein
VHKAQQVLLARPVHRESLALKEQLVLKEFKALLEQQDHKVRKVTKE